MAIKRVWIEEGCIVCNACETTCPEVFNVTEDSCHIRAEVRIDGKQTTNLTERSDLTGALGQELADQIPGSRRRLPGRGHQVRVSWLCAPRAARQAAKKSKG